MEPPFLREHRIYQADWLIRFYGFASGEILAPDRPFLDLNLDPKIDWALRHLDRFPVEINRADYLTLLRVPGIGPVAARRILDARRCGRLHLDNLSRLGVVMKRARYFLACQGKVLDRAEDPALVRQRLLGGTKPLGEGRYRQLEPQPNPPTPSLKGRGWGVRS